MKLFKFFSLLPAFCFLLFLTACQTTVSDKKMPKAFFDASDFFNAEIIRLDSLKPAVIKTVTVNDKSETKELATLNYTEELAPFVQSDINKPAWLDWYRTDTMRNEDTVSKYLHTHILYTALKTSLKTKKFLVHLDSLKQPIAIDILNSDDNAIAGAQHELHYDKRSGFSINNKQHLALSKDSDVKVVVIFK